METGSGRDADGPWTVSSGDAAAYDEDGPWTGRRGVDYQVPGSDVDTAVSLIHRLRTLGVRTHFWI